jgi:hypothetical protein
LHTEMCCMGSDFLLIIVIASLIGCPNTITFLFLGCY